MLGEAPFFGGGQKKKWIINAFHFAAVVLCLQRSNTGGRLLSARRTHPIFTLPLIHSDSPVPRSKWLWLMAGFQTNNHVVFFPAGFLHYGDISRAVSKAEAQALGNIIDEAVRAITPDAILTLTGGFRRYKTFLLSVLIFEDETQRHLQSFLAPPHPPLLFCSYYTQGKQRH